MPDLSWRAIGVGALVAALIAVPTALLSQALDSTDAVDDDSAWLFVFFLVVVAGLGFGGGVAATKRPDAPLSHGTLAALLAFVVVQALGAVRRLASGDEVSWLGIAFSATVAAAAGLLGALVADRLARRR